MAKENTKATVQKVGRSLSAMVMPNIGAFVAWGLITALFIDTGWLYRVLAVCGRADPVT